MYKVVIKLNNLTNIVVNMSYSQLVKFRLDIHSFIWLILNNYTNDLENEVEININNISVILYKEIKDNK